MLTIEELTELEIVLDLNIKNAIANGWIIQPFNVMDKSEKICCLVGSALLNINNPSPTTCNAIHCLDLSEDDGMALVNGFDSGIRLCDLGKLGLKFRNKIKSGEYGDMT